MSQNTERNSPRFYYEYLSFAVQQRIKKAEKNKNMMRWMTTKMTSVVNNSNTLFMPSVMALSTDSSTVKDILVQLKVDCNCQSVRQVE